MKEKLVNTIIRIIYIISTLLILAGALFQIQHYAYGSTLFFTGFILGTIVTVLNTIRLKRKNRKLEEQLREKE